MRALLQISTIILTTLMSLNACGHKGPLLQPTEEPPKKVSR